MTLSESLKELETQKRHECCKDAKDSLYPPHVAGVIYVGNIQYKPSVASSWFLSIDTDDSSAEVNVKFCPWCGEELPK